MNDEEVRRWWQEHGSERAKAQTVKEWLLEYDLGEPWVSKRLVEENPIAV